MTNLHRTTGARRALAVGQVYEIKSKNEPHMLIVHVGQDGWGRARYGRFDASTQVFTTSPRRGIQSYEQVPDRFTEGIRFNLVGDIPVEVAESYFRDERRSWINVGNLYAPVPGGQRYYLVTAIELAPDRLPRSIECLVGECIEGKFLPDGTVLTFDAPPDFDTSFQGGLSRVEALSLRSSVVATESQG